MRDAQHRHQVTRRAHRAIGWFLTLAAVLAAGPARATTLGALDYDRVSHANVVVPMVFPVFGPTPWCDTFLAPRAGGRRRHHGQDLMVPKMRPLLATFSGVAYPHLSRGNHYIITLVGDNGWTTYYMHVNNDTPGTDDGRGGTRYAFAPGVRSGVRVKAGQHIGWVGDSGNAEGGAPHLHFEIHHTASDAVINPAASLRCARHIPAQSAPEPPLPPDPEGEPLPLQPQGEPLPPEPEGDTLPQEPETAPAPPAPVAAAPAPAVSVPARPASVVSVAAGAAPAASYAAKPASAAPVATTPAPVASVAAAPAPLVSVAARPDSPAPGAAAPALEFSIAPDEICLEGVVHSVDASQQRIVLEAVAFYLHGGKRTALNPPRLKQIRVEADTRLQVVGEPGRTVSLDELQGAWRLRVVGKDMGIGSELPARVLAVELGTGEDRNAG